MYTFFIKDLKNAKNVLFMFTGLRCEYQTGFLNYFVAFLCMAGVNMGLMISLIALFVIYCQRRRHNYQSQPQIIKKSPGRARVFSTSSSSGSRRSRSKSGCKPNHANSNHAFDSNSDPHPLDNNCNSSSKSHSCSALLGDDGQVLDLEDCCQMTICEKVHSQSVKIAEIYLRMFGKNLMKATSSLEMI